MRRLSIEEGQGKVVLLLSPNVDHFISIYMFFILLRNLLTFPTHSECHEPPFWPEIHSLHNISPTIANVLTTIL